MDLTTIEQSISHELTTLRAHIRRMGPEAPEPPTGDFFDAAQDVENRERGHLQSARLADRVRRLTRALERVRTGRYGECSECGGPIGLRRLRAIPDADTCVTCQEQIEQRRCIAALAGRLD
jgi:DnaK suppressor protein